jgi:hypothetical protein
MGSHKKGQLRHFLIAILLFSAVITGYFVFESEVFNYYGVSVGNEFGSFYSYVNDSVVSTSSELNTNFTENLEGSEGLAQADTPGVTTNLFKAILLPLKAVGTSISMLTEIGKLLHLPSWFLNILYIMISSMVVYWIWSAVRGKDT